MHGLPLEVLLELATARCSLTSQYVAPVPHLEDLMKLRLCSGPGLEFLILLPPALEFWGYGPAPPHAVSEIPGTELVLHARQAFYTHTQLGSS